MMKHYLTLAMRNALRKKAFSLINILGLSLGLSCSLLIWLWVKDEKAIDAFHRNDNYLYTVVQRSYHDGVIDAGHATPGLLGEELKAVFPEVQYATVGVWEELHTFEAGNKILKQPGTYGGQDFFLMFSYALLEGQAETALNTPVDIAISQKMAEAFFGSTEAAMGQSIRFEKKKDLTVSAVFENIPATSSQRFDYILNAQTFLEEHSWAKDWGNNGPSTFIMLRPGTDVKAFERKITTFIDRYSREENFTRRLSLQKYSDMYLHSTFKNGELAGGRIQYVNLFSVVGILVLIIACINFINITTARSIKRSKEIGVRKVVGAARTTLICQFIGETFLIVFVAFISATVIVNLALPAFNTLTQKQMVFPLNENSFWVGSLLLGTFTAFVSGIYPALYLSSFNPVKALKGRVAFGSGAFWFRKSLVTFQFSLSILLIIGAIVISLQVKYIQSLNLGYDRDNLIFVKLEGPLAEKYHLFKNELLTKPSISDVSRISDQPTNLVNRTTGVDWEGKDPSSKIQFTHASVGYDFVKTMNINMIQGRDFLPGFPSDSAAFLLNETALKQIGYNDPIGRPITLWGRRGWIIGIMEDFHFNSLHTEIRPMILRLEEAPGSDLALVRSQPGQTVDALEAIKRTYKSLNPRFPITYKFSDEEYAKWYVSEHTAQTLSNLFASMAVFISSLGLFGLTMFVVEQRTREISIRKILGATSSSLFGILSGEVILLIVLSFCIACPLGWYLMDDWLEAYAYRIELTWWIFVLAGGLTFVIALTTMSFQTIRALLLNPVKTLRME